MPHHQSLITTQADLVIDNVVVLILSTTVSWKRNALWMSDELTATALPFMLSKQNAFEVTNKHDLSIF